MKKNSLAVVNSYTLYKYYKTEHHTYKETPYVSKPFDMVVTFTRIFPIAVA